MFLLNELCMMWNLWTSVFFWMLINGAKPSLHHLLPISYPSTRSLTHQPETPLCLVQPDLELNTIVFSSRSGWWVSQQKSRRKWKRKSKKQSLRVNRTSLSQPKPFCNTVILFFSQQFHNFLRHLVITWCWYRICDNSDSRRLQRLFVHPSPPVHRLCSFYCSNQVTAAK